MQKHRKLAAIMFTDIVGYTALMAKDEDNALRILQRNRDIVKLLVSQFNGELLKEIGDGTLSSFSSVVDAVNCALEIQHLLSNEPDFKLRIGIHIGDVVVEKGDVFGDGVNVASRIENMAEPGGICISDRVYYDIKNKPVLEATFLGEKKLKNIDSPVKVYSLTRGGTPAPATKPLDDEQIKSRKGMSPALKIILPLTVVIIIIVGYSLYSHFGVKEKPAPQEAEIKSIAVLAFDDMSPNKDQEWFCDGIAEAIINALTHVEGLHVCARNSSFSFKGQHPDVREVGRKLNVEAVLEGSVVKSDSKLRITTQLVNVADGFHIWSETYDRDTEEVFDLLEEISLAVVNELKIKLLDKEKAAIAKRPTENLEAYDLYLMGRHYGGIDYYIQALDKDPDFALAYTGIADYFNLAGHWADCPAFYPVGKAAAERALEIDDTLAEAYVSLAFVSMYYDFDCARAVNCFKRAIELNPGYFLAHLWYSNYFIFTGRLDEALEELKQAEKLNPLYYWSVSILMEVYMLLDRYDEAMVQFEKLKEFKGSQNYTYLYLANLFTYQGKYKDAIAAIQKISDDSRQHTYLGYIYAVSGERDKAEQVLHEHIEQQKEYYKSFEKQERINLLRAEKIEHYLPSLDIKQVIREIEKQTTEQHFISTYETAVIYAGLGDYDKAFEILEYFYEIRSPWLFRITYKRELESLRSDPRFKALLKKMGLPE